MEDKKNAITVLGSANCDYFFVVDRLPSVGETLSASSVMICCGGKGANQASTIGKQNYRVNFIAQVGNDSAGPVILNTLKEFNVDPSSISTVENIPTGQAYIFSLPSKDNSIVLVGGANTNWKNDSLANLDKHLASSRYLLLQREIPNHINLEGAKAAQRNGVEVVLDFGGEDTVIPKELLGLIDIISPNETELERILGKKVNVEVDEEIINYLNEVRIYSNNKKLKMLLKLGSSGSVFIDENNQIYKQKTFKFDDMPILDTTGAGDCFTASFSCQLLENKSIQESLLYATCAAYCCICKFGTMPSLPSKQEVIKLLDRVQTTNK